MNLPDGWVAESPSHMPDCVVLFSPGGVGCATIDYGQRIFGFGYGQPRAPKGCYYSGRGWKDRIVADAIRELTAIMGEPPVK